MTKSMGVSLYTVKYTEQLKFKFVRSYTEVYTDGTKTDKVSLLI